MATFIEKASYDDGVEKIAAALSEPCRFAGVVTADQVKLALGEYLDIWPDSIAPECAKPRKP